MKNAENWTEKLFRHTPIFETFKTLYEHSAIMPSKAPSIYSIVSGLLLQDYHGSIYTWTPVLFTQ